MGFFRLLLAFLIIFNFPVPVAYNSAAAAFLLATTYYVINDRNPLPYFRLTYILYILAGLVFITLASAIPAVLHFTFDFSILKAFALQLFLMLVLVYCMPVLLGDPWENAGAGFDTAATLLVSVFTVQSVIQVLAFIFPPVADMVHFFQKESVAGKDYGGIRALALSGNPFFDLSAAYAVCYIVFVKLAVNRARMAIQVTDVIFFLLLIVGTFFAGRTGFIGLGIALLTMAVYARGTPFKVFSFLKVFFVCLVLVWTLPWLLPADTRDLLFDKLLPFAFEFLYSYLEQGSVATASTDVLSTMYFPIGINTFLFGDGRYLMADGSYYLYTDAGYMRHILYYGIFGQLLLVGYQLLFFLKPLLISLGGGFEKRPRNDLFFWMVLLAVLFVLHYKGEVVGFMPVIALMLLLLGTGYVKDKYEAWSIFYT
ncbi:hypothetical protein [Chitinophaga japonensis]|uniref:Uncharacterized protein n=1 Tax=Chitinophaga japonensis TaxID=104662 RepID=A0A562T5E5_CHIJA|nr:hypothetical protein [Chitinophaga japonensis]TWI88220.1 hypothetical protein LX66_2303 [Chitinophaga japonensis]